MHSDALAASGSGLSAAPGGLLAELPAAWRGESIGAGIEDWERFSDARSDVPLNLAGLPMGVRGELAWMAHWQFRDGMRVTVRTFNRVAAALLQAQQQGRAAPRSLVGADAFVLDVLGARRRDAVVKLPRPRTSRTPTAFGPAGLALSARLHDGPWWELEVWSPRCDRRIPVRDREPDWHRSADFTSFSVLWLRRVAQWSLGGQLETGALTWTTVQHDRVPNLVRFGRWLQTLEDPEAAVTDLSAAPRLAAAYRRWVGAPGNRTRDGKVPATVTARSVNDDVRVVVELLAYMAENRDEAHHALGPSPWDAIDDALPAVWARQVTRVAKNRLLDASQYLDSHALAQITAHLPVLGTALDEVVPVTTGATTRMLRGYGDPQAMRMLMLQIMTGRRANEICLCETDCLSPAPPGAVKAAAGERIARFHYAQSKIEGAGETIFVDEAVIGLIEEQRRWVREQFPRSTPRYLFQRTMSNLQAARHYPMGSYQTVLREFSRAIGITDSTGRPVIVSHTHRFRHTRLTDLAEQGVPVHVLQRYAGHRSPEMTMHYIAQREEYAEQAFLATRRFTADGTHVTFSATDRDAIHLFERADRFLPNGYCLLPPLQTCQKGNACLTCSVFVTDDSHTDTLTRQLDETEALIKRVGEQFRQRHGQPMPEGNVWLVERRAERDALLRLLHRMRTNPGKPCQGAGSNTGPTPVTIEPARRREEKP